MYGTNPCAAIASYSSRASSLNGSAYSATRTGMPRSWSAFSCWNCGPQ